MLCLCPVTYLCPSFHRSQRPHRHPDIFLSLVSTWYPYLGYFLGIIPTIQGLCVIPLRGWHKYCALMDNIYNIRSLSLLQVVQHPNHWYLVKRSILRVRSWISIQHLSHFGWSVPTIYIFAGNVKFRHYLIYQVLLRQVDSSTTLYFYAEPRKSCRYPLTVRINLDLLRSSMIW